MNIALLRAIRSAVPIGGCSRPIGLQLDMKGSRLEVHTDQAAVWLRSQLANRGALGFRNVQFSSPDELAVFARSIGEDLIPVNKYGTNVQLYISKGGARPPLPSDSWHSDNSYNVQPAHATVLYSLDCGGVPTSTHLCDATLAYATLDNALRARLFPGGSVLLGEHESDSSSDRRATHPAVRAHPLTGRPALYLSPVYTKRLLTPERSPLSDSDALLAAIFEHMFSSGKGGGKEKYCTQFVWQQPGDCGL